MPAISIVVPVYKAERYLAQCVDSILQQTVADLELILVDDGSPDASPVICDAYAAKDSRVKVIHKENGGVTSARKAGIAAASADFVGFVDADDYVVPTMFGVLLDAAEQYHVDLVECGYYEVENGPEERFVSEVFRLLTQQEIAAEVLTPLLNESGSWRCFLAWTCWNKIYSTALLKQAMEYDDESVSIGEDMLQNIFYLTKCKSAAILAGECNYYYRRSDTSVMRSKSVHIGEVAYMKRGAACAAQMGYTGEGLRNLIDYTLLHDLLKVMFYMKTPLSEKVSLSRRLVGLVECKSRVIAHGKSQGVLTKICLRVMLWNVAALQWLLLAALNILCKA